MSAHDWKALDMRYMARRTMATTGRRALGAYQHSRADAGHAESIGNATSARTADSGCKHGGCIVGDPRMATHLGGTAQARASVAKRMPTGKQWRLVRTNARAHLARSGPHTQPALHRTTGLRLQTSAFPPMELMVSFFVPRPGSNEAHGNGGAANCQGSGRYEAHEARGRRGG